MKYHFLTEHEGDKIILSLLDEGSNILWYAEMDRVIASKLIDCLNSGYMYHPVLFIGGFSIAVIGENFGACLLMISNDSVMLFKVLLSKTERHDLATTIRLHVIMSEEETRPKDVLPPPDDRSTGWSPEKERDKYGGIDDRDDEVDSADWWKK